jgi:hypothetical protein
MRRAFLIAAAALSGAGTAGAEAPPLPECRGVMLERQETAWSDYDPFFWPGDIVAYSRLGGAGETVYQYVVEHCPSRNRMEAEFAIPADPDAEWVDVMAYTDWLYGALTSTETYTLADLANAAQGFGANARTARVSYESCGCRLGRMR